MRRQKERGRSDRAFVVIDGKRHKLGTWGSEAAEDRYRELLALSMATAPASATPRPTEDRDTRPTLTELMAVYLRHVIDTFPDNPAEVWHHRAAFRILKSEFGDTFADEFGPRKLRAVRAAMEEKGWSRRYINTEVNRIRRLFKWCASQELIDASIFQALATIDGLRVGRTKAPEPRVVLPVPDEVVEATLPEVNATVADMVAVQRLCGCRPGELCQMASRYIDRSGDVWLYSPPRHKTSHHGKRRVITLGPTAQSVLQKYLFSEGEFFPYNPSTYRQAIRRACDRAFPSPEGLSEADAKGWRKAHRWQPNQLRHLAATKVRAEFGIEGAQHTLGHARAQTTEVYAERNLEQAKAIALRMG